jgi:hypothetical protein
VKQITLIAARAVLTAALAAGLAGFPGCGGDDTTAGPEKPPDDGGADSIAPVAVGDLRVKAPTYESVALVWTAPGDDGALGTASKYDIRWSKSLITEDNWTEAVCVDTACVPVPKPAGRIETIVLRGLDSGSRYYFALKTADEANNLSGLSNCATERTLDEAFPPSDVTDLVARAVSSTQFELTWTAPGDDYMNGTADRYDIRFSRNPMDDEDDWNAASPAGPLPSPKPAGVKESVTVEVPVANEGFVFAIKTADELSNWSGLSNSAPGMGFDDDLWLTPNVLHPGGQFFICFRACPDGPTHLTIDDHGWVAYCCGPMVVACLAEGTYAEGVYSIAFDFCDDLTGECLPFDVYYSYLCWNYEEHKKMPFYFEP